MSLKRNFEYIRDWCNARFLKKSDQIEVDLSDYTTKNEVDEKISNEIEDSRAWTFNYPEQADSGIHTRYGSTRSPGTNSLAEGSNTASIGTGSHAEGFLSESRGNYSHAEGYYTTTSNENEHAQGRYNKSNTYGSVDLVGDRRQTVFSHGIGTSNNARKNAIEIMGNGDLYLLGIGGYTGDNFITSSTVSTVIGDLENSVSTLQTQNLDSRVTAIEQADFGTQIENSGKINAVTINGVPATINNKVANLSLTKSSAGAGSLVTDVSINGNTITVTKGNVNLAVKENVSNKVTSLSSSSTDTQYPSAKVVYDELTNIELVAAAAMNDLNDNKENISNKVTSISAISNDEQYPSAKCVYDLINSLETRITELEQIIQSQNQSEDPNNEQGGE